MLLSVIGSIRFSETVQWTCTFFRLQERTTCDHDADEWQLSGQIRGHGVAGGRLVHGQRDAVAEGLEPGELGRGQPVVVVVVVSGVRQSVRVAERRRRGRRPQRDGGRLSRGHAVVRRHRHARHGRRRHNDRDRCDHVDHQPYDHADEDDRETEEKDSGRGKHAPFRGYSCKYLCEIVINDGSLRTKATERYRSAVC